MSIYRKISTILLLAALGLSLTATTFASAPVEAYAMDTVAGSRTVLRSSTLPDSQSYYFLVEKPDGQSLKLPASVTESVALTEFSDYWTRESGNYYISVHSEDGLVNSVKSEFYVHAGDVSTTDSALDPDNQTARTYDDSAEIMVSLVDDYGNPVDKHVVQLISSTAGGNIRYANSHMTDDFGEISFIVESAEEGTTTYTAYDMTADTELDARAKVAYFEDAADVWAIPEPDEYRYSAAGGPGEIDRLEFEDIPTDMPSGEAVSITVTAYDSEDMEVIDYEGEVRFYAEGDNADYATLPPDYTFTLDDLGSHTFSLSFLFQHEGSYSLGVVDTDDALIYGEIDVEVGDELIDPGSGIVTITNPVTGTYSNPVQVISGTAVASSDLEIYDNDVVVGDTTADVNGAFSFTTGLLADGEHSLYVAMVNDVGTILATSSIIDITVDDSAPEITDIVVEPIGIINPNSEVTLKVYVEDTLANGSIFIDGTLYDMVENPFGYYEVTFASPIEFGDYPAVIILTDQLGNESRFEDLFELTVGPGGIEDVQQTFIPNVLNVVADYNDHQVILKWDTVMPNVYPVDHYRVYFGEQPDQLYHAVDTFSAATTWYVPDLINGKTYYFAVIAVDIVGNISDSLSNVVSAVPNPKLGGEIEDPCVAEGTCDDGALDDMEDDVSDTGPGIVGLLFASGLGGYFYNVGRRRKNGSLV